MNSKLYTIHLYTSLRNKIEVNGWPIYKPREWSIYGVDRLKLLCVTQDCIVVGDVIENTKYRIGI